MAPLLIPSAVAGFAVPAAVISLVMKEGVLPPGMLEIGLSAVAEDICVIVASAGVLIVYWVCVWGLPDNRLILGYRKQVWKVLFHSSWIAGFCIATLLFILIVFVG